jgi:MoaA/NifB/PqqE/SkfB family radical SAM enzyme
MSFIPAIIDLELTNRCNLDCAMCPRIMQKMRLGDMSREILDGVLDEVLEWPGRIFRLHGIGEPLMAPQFRYAVERIKADPRGHRIDLVTNGQLLDREMTRFLLRHAVDTITVSVGAATEEAYRAVRGGRHFEKVVRNAVGAIDERDRRGAPTKIEVQLVRVPPADAQEQAFIDFWSRFDVTIEVWRDINRGRRAFDDVLTLDRPPCEMLRDYTVVCWEGRVGICCVDVPRFHIVGDVTQESLQQIYNGKRIQSLRDLHERRETSLMPLCVDCSFRDGKHIAYSCNVFRAKQGDN